MPKDQPREITLDDLNDLTRPLFARLREISVFEVLKAAGEQADDLAEELRREGAPLAAIGTGRQLSITGNNVQFQDWDLVFADWRAAGPGANLSQQLRRRLERGGMKCEALTTLPVPDSLPTADKIMVFRARHLIALDAFNGVMLLEDAYRQRRSQIPSPHLFPEEKGTAQLEAASESLCRDGYIPTPLGRLSPLEVVLCRDLELLQYTAAAIAGDLVDWQRTDLIKKTGDWVVTTNDKKVIIGTDEDLGKVLTRIMHADDHAARESRQALEEAGRLITKRTDGISLIKAFVSEGSAIAMGSAERVLRVAAAILVSG